MLKDQKVRKRIARENHLLFFSTYFGHYIQYDFADFHREMFELSANEKIPTLVITAARGIGKSTILNMSLAIWSVLGKSRKKYVIILSHTQTKARQHFINLRKEFEENTFLKSDLGPFKEDSNEWGVISRPSVLQRSYHLCFYRTKYSRYEKHAISSRPHYCRRP